LIIFPRKIKGREDALSITIPHNIAETYGMLPGDYVNVTLKKTPKDTKEIRFAKKISKCGSQGTLLYVPKHIIREHGLKRNMTFWVYIEEV